MSACVCVCSVCMCVSACVCVCSVCVCVSVCMCGDGESNYEYICEFIMYGHCFQQSSDRKEPLPPLFACWHQPLLHADLCLCFQFQHQQLLFITTIGEF